MPAIAALVVTIAFHLYLIAVMVRIQAPRDHEPPRDVPVDAPLVVRLIGRHGQSTRRDHHPVVRALLSTPHLARTLPEVSAQPGRPVAMSVVGPVSSDPTPSDGVRDDRVSREGTSGRMAGTLEQAWTPRGESSIDTAARRAIDTVTIKGQIKIGGSVIADCSGGPGTPNPDMQGISLASVGCHGAYGFLHEQLGSRGRHVRGEVVVPPMCHEWPDKWLVGW